MVNDSKFQMWRGTIALVQVDDIVTNEEKLWLDEHLKKIPFSLEQKEILKTDFSNGIEIDDILLSKIEPRERGMLVSFANTIFKRDGLVESEEKVLNDLTQKILGNLNMDEIIKEVENLEDAAMKNSDGSIFKRLLNIVTSII